MSHESVVLVQGFIRFSFSPLILDHEKLRIFVLEAHV